MVGRCKEIDVFELVPPETTPDPDREITVLHPAEVELGETIKLIFERIDQSTPSRVVIDSLSELRVLAQNSLRYRRQILALKHFFAKRNCTVVLLDDLTAKETDLQLHSISHGVVLLEQLAIDYGAQRRRLSVINVLGIGFRGGFHDVAIDKGGMEIFPRLVAAEHHKTFAGEFTPERQCGIRQAFGRWTGKGNECTAHWCGRRRQIVPGTHVRRSGSRAG